MVIVSNKLSESVNQQVDSSQAHSRGQIQKVDFGGIAILRQEDQWVSLPKQAVSIQVAQTIGQHWQQLLSKSAKPIDSQINTGHTVLLFFGGSNKPIICKVKERGKMMIFQFIESNLEFEIDARLQHLYLPQ